MLTVCTVLAATTAVFAQTQLTNFHSTTGRDYSGPGNFATFNDQLFFTASNNKTGKELWKTNGTAESCALVKDINLGFSSSITSNLQVFKGKLYFVATDGIYGYQLWQSDGTAAARAANNIRPR